MIVVSVAHLSLVLVETFVGHGETWIDEVGTWIYERPVMVVQGVVSQMCRVGEVNAVVITLLAEERGQTLVGREMMMGMLIPMVVEVVDGDLLLPS